jgi:hypothetical protein
MTDSITARLAALPQTSTHDLKALWTELYDKPASAFSRAYLISRLAYRLQELHFGGLKPATAPASTRWRMVSTRSRRGSAHRRGCWPAPGSAANGRGRSTRSRFCPTASTTRADATRACRPSPAP